MAERPGVRDVRINKRRRDERQDMPNRIKAM
jgi:hypothetical protein